MAAESDKLKNPWSYVRDCDDFIQIRTEYQKGTAVTTMDVYRLLRKCIEIKNGDEIKDPETRFS